MKLPLCRPGNEGFQSLCQGRDVLLRVGGGKCDPEAREIPRNCWIADCRSKKPGCQQFFGGGQCGGFAADDDRDNCARVFGQPE